METIKFTSPSFEALTLNTNEPPYKGTLKRLDSFSYTENIKQPVFLGTNDDPSFIFALNKNILGGAKFKLKDLLSGRLIAKVISLLAEKNGKPEDLIVYFCPSLGFMDCPIDDITLLQIKKAGLGNAVKGCGGIHIDLPLAFTIQLREIGVPFVNINISKEYTKDNKDILHSKSRGDKKLNYTFARLLK